MITPNGRSTGLLLALGSAAAFGVSGGFAKSLLDIGWTPGAAVTIRILGAALVLLVPTLIAMRSRWHLVRRHVGPLLGYGGLGVVGAQLCYFQALAYLPVGVALLLEYTAPVLVVLWVWLTTRHAPGRLTVLGGLVAMSGLVLVIDPSGGSSLHPLGVLWALAAAVGAAAYFIVAGATPDPDAATERIPPIAFVGLAMLVGAVVVAVISATGLLPFATRSADILLAGQRLPWWVAVLGMIGIATVLSYLTGLAGAQRLGAQLASFVALTEVIFAVLAAWLLVGELPGVIQIAGGGLIVGGVLIVRLAELRRPTRVARATPAPVEPVLSGTATAS